RRSRRATTSTVPSPWTTLTKSLPATVAPSPFRVLDWTLQITHPWLVLRDQRFQRVLEFLGGLCADRTGHLEHDDRGLILWQGSGFVAHGCPPARATIRAPRSLLGTSFTPNVPPSRSPDPLLQGTASCRR